jgi:hypothetical protein
VNADEAPIGKGDESMSTQDDLVTAIADRMAIEELIVKYAKGRDTTDADLYREIFAEDATIGLPGGKVFSKNRDEILAKVADDVVRFNPGKQDGTASYAIMRHEVGNILITISGDTARSEYYIDTLAYNETEKRPEFIATGRNEDEYRRVDGRWQITKSILIFQWENERMGQALRVGVFTPPEYRR